MKKLKTILQSKKFLFFSLIFLLLEMLFVIKIIKHDSVYHDGYNSITGYVIKYENNNGYLKCIIKSKEKIIGNYYYKNKTIPNIKIGTKVRITGIVQNPGNNTIPNTFNYKRYLYNNHIYKIINIEKLIIISQKKNPFVIIKNRMIERARNNSYLSLFIIGDKSELDQELYNKYKSVGVAHLLAISGMHISVVITILNKVLFLLKKNIRFYLIILVLFIYAYLIGYTPSVLRVIFFYILSFINEKYIIKLNPLMILYLSLYILLIINPFYIFNIGFLYSFITSFSIINSNKFHSRNYFFNIVITTFFALLYTLPLTVSLNYEINLVVFISNLLLIPFISFIVFPFSLITFIFPILLGVFIPLTRVVDLLVYFLGNIHFLVFVVPKLNVFFIVSYYSLVLLFTYYNNYKYLIVIIIIIFFHKNISSFHNAYEVTFFDVKQGDSSLITNSNNKQAILIDTGGLYYSNVSDNIITYLKSVGISKLSGLVLTHGDYDHMGEAINLINNFKVEKVIFNCGSYNDLEKELIKVLDKKKIKYYSCIDKLDNLYFLQTKEYDNENDNSNVIYTELNGSKFMFMGDASTTTEKEILDKYNLPKIDVLKVGHHGSKTSSGKDFINEINPKYSIISVGKNNRYGHPNKEVLDDLSDSKIYRTDQDGSIMFKIKNNKLKIETCKP